MARIEGWDADREIAVDIATCDRAEFNQLTTNQCWARRQRIRTLEALEAYSWALGATRGRPDHAFLPAALSAWRRYRDATCALAGAAYKGGSMEPMTVASCHANRAIEWTTEMYLVIRTPR
ncbi:MAG: lysozyme inhibitor LprI family protein [Gemmatimonadaceae bacterium]|jgi:uncharacterized protein YecT (DUF1311 family)|nr:lysozyme inhibitor LprI family protein [Gemmatimonadaceae bacterium]